VRSPLAIVGLLVAAAAACMTAVPALADLPARDPWTAQEVATIASMRLKAAAPLESAASQ